MSLAMPSSPLGRLIVCERRGHWAAALRRELSESGLRVWETRLLADCWQSLTVAPASFLVVELSLGNAEALLGRMMRLPTEYPLARVAVVAERRLTAYEWLVREAGAVHFVSSPRELGPLAQIGFRHMAAVPPPHKTFVERVWDGLPWRQHKATADR